MPPSTTEAHPDAQGSRAHTSRALVSLWLEAVIVAVTADVPRVLTVRLPAGAAAGTTPEREPRSGPVPDSGNDTAPGTTSVADRVEPRDALPAGPLEPDLDRTLERGLRRWVRERTDLELGYVEQLYTFGDRFRHPSEIAGGPRVVSAAYLALVHEMPPVGGAETARWRDAYAFLPWEDHRSGMPDVIARHIGPALDGWVAAAEGGRARTLRRERADIAFGLSRASWDVERTLARYELLYEVGLVDEAATDAALLGIGPECGAGASGSDLPGSDCPGSGAAAPDSYGRGPFETDRPAPVAGGIGRPMVRDHRRILATALGRLRAKVKYRPVVFELLPEAFTLGQLQRVVEALSGVHIHKSNFRRLVERGGLVEGTGMQHGETGGRPAEIFRFRREVLRERRAPGVGLPLRRPDAG